MEKEKHLVLVGGGVAFMVTTRAKEMKSQGASLLTVGPIRQENGQPGKVESDSSCVVCKQTLNGQLVRVLYQGLELRVEEHNPERF